jgi:hypothetical protein
MARGDRGYLPDLLRDWGEQLRDRASVLADGLHPALNDHRYKRDPRQVFDAGGLSRLAAERLEEQFRSVPRHQ